MGHTKHIIKVLREITGTKRIIEKNRTYRVPVSGEQAELFQVLDISGDKLKLKNLKNNQTKTMSKKTFQTKLNNGEIYVSAAIDC